MPRCIVPRYFFHVQDGQDRPDRCGTPLAGVDDARAAAIVAAGEALKDLGARFWTHAQWRMHVTDEQGATVCELRLSDQPGLAQDAPQEPTGRDS